MLQDIKQLKDTSLLLRTLGGFWLLALVVLGVCGSIFKIAAPDGWIARALGSDASVGAAAMASVLFIGVMGWFARDWASPAEENRIADLVLYSFAAAGLLFMVRMATGGTF
ncbi:MAG: hypothetical protein WCA09_12875 [Burkholderiales bacterium]